MRWEGDLFAGQEDGHGDGQVVGRALFPEVGRGQVDPDAALGEGAAGVLDGGPDAFAGPLDGGIG